MSDSPLRDRSPRGDAPDTPDGARNGPLTDAGVGVGDDDWEWRRRVRASPRSARIYRIGVFILGLVVFVVGLLLIPFPGPGWLIVIGGLAIWATEFERAQRILELVKRNVRAWEQWAKRQNPLVKALVGVCGLAFVAAVLWVALHFSGIPGFFPDGLESWMRNTARI